VRNYLHGTSPIHAHASDGDLDYAHVNVPLVHAHEDENDTQTDPALDPLGYADVWRHHDAYLDVGVDARG
jgi:hypothetical protein